VVVGGLDGDELGGLERWDRLDNFEIEAFVIKGRESPVVVGRIV
jgi:hypothetical protein